MTAAKRPNAGKPGSRKAPTAKASAGKPAGKPSAKPVAKPTAKSPAKPVAAKPEPPPPPAVKQPARSVLLPKLVKALKAQYKPVAPVATRPVLDQVLFACCLENAPADVAEKAVARLVAGAFDLNEIRVTTVAELAEVLHDLPDPPRAALALRRALQSVFESTYAFSLDQAKKHSLAHGLKTLESLHGVSPFVVNYVASTSLGAHMIPLDHGALAALYLCGIITLQEYDSGKVAGLEKLIPKKAAAEFNSLLHQFGIECLTNLHGATVKKILQAVNPAAKDRFPKRGEPLPPPSPPPPPPRRKARRRPRRPVPPPRPIAPRARRPPRGRRARRRCLLRARARSARPTARRPAGSPARSRSWSSRTWASRSRSSPRRPRLLLPRSPRPRPRRPSLPTQSGTRTS